MNKMLAGDLLGSGSGFVTYSESYINKYPSIRGSKDGSIPLPGRLGSPIALALRRTRTIRLDAAKAIMNKMLAGDLLGSGSGFVNLAQAAALVGQRKLCEAALAAFEKGSGEGGSGGAGGGGNPPKPQTLKPEP